MVDEYLDEKDIIHMNKRVLQKAVKKADKHKILNKAGISKAVMMQRQSKDEYSNAIDIMSTLSDKNLHPFDSGNRRTGLLAGLSYLTINKKPIANEVMYSEPRVMQGMRENYYSKEELKNWLKSGKIRRFER